MTFWLVTEHESAGDLIQSDEDRRYNLSLGHEPMRENMFRYLVTGILRGMKCRTEEYLSIAYEPIRPDGLSAVQTNIPCMGEAFHVEIVVSAETERGFSVYCRKDISLQETIEIFRKVLVLYQYPDLSEWNDVTEVVRYLE